MSVGNLLKLRYQEMLKKDFSRFPLNDHRQRTDMLFANKHNHSGGGNANLQNLYLAAQ